MGSEMCIRDRSTSSAVKSAKSPGATTPDDSATEPLSPGARLALAVRQETLKQDERSAPKPATPQADALFKAIGWHIDDADDAERKLLIELTDFLWSGVYITGVHIPGVP